MCEPRVLVIQHVPHERLGTLEEGLRKAGCALSPFNAFEKAARWPSIDDLDGIVIMGGPQSVYHQGRYPYLTRELILVHEAIAQRLPVLGICLGAQLLAEAIGGPGTVRAAQQPEIGWHPLMREPGAFGDPVMDGFGPAETVFQWHGDTVVLPRGAVRLASSPRCREQAFCYHGHAYGLQFHVEVTEAMIRAWMRHPAKRRELEALHGIVDPLLIRRQSPQHVDRLKELARHVADAFVGLINATRPCGMRHAERGVERRNPASRIPHPAFKQSSETARHACR